MTITEAAELVIQAGALAEGGDVFVLNMGEPIKIIELAKRMVKLSGMEVKDDDNPDGEIEIELTGLRPGEKLYEELLIGENVNSTSHNQIYRAEEDFMHWKELSPLLDKIEDSHRKYDAAKLINLLKEAVSGFEHQK